MAVETCLAFIPMFSLWCGIWKKNDNFTSNIS